MFYKIAQLANCKLIVGLRVSPILASLAAVWYEFGFDPVNYHPWVDSHFSYFVLTCDVCVLCARFELHRSFSARFEYLLKPLRWSCFANAVSCSFFGVGEVQLDFAKRFFVAKPLWLHSREVLLHYLLRVPSWSLVNVFVGLAVFGRVVLPKRILLS